MCDTWVAMPNTTARSRVILAKNSDRPIFDCQPLFLRPRKTWPAGSQVRAGALSLPQAEVTYAHLGSSPYWCWGYEEGINEWGLVIGNEAVYTRALRETAHAASGDGPAPAAGLLGMNLIRLALERCRTAAGAVDLIGKLVEEHGQFDSGVPGVGPAQGSYDNAFLLADPAEAWVLETAGQRWVARRIAAGCASISNQLSIRDHWDKGSSDVVDYARGRDWWPDPGGLPFDFARAYIDQSVPRQVSHIRAARSRSLLEQRAGQIDEPWMMRIARDHLEDSFLGGPLFDPASPDFHTLCMHASPAGFTWGNTASSCVAVLPAGPDELPVFWWTPGTPCGGCYVPFFPHAGELPESVSTAGARGKVEIPAVEAAEDTFSAASYWWLFRRLNDRVKGAVVGSQPGCYATRQPIVRARFDALEASFAARLPGVLARAATLRADSAAAQQVLSAFTASCVAQVQVALEDLLAAFPPIPGE